jgi:hypothetical protein
MPMKYQRWCSTVAIKLNSASEACFFHKESAVLNDLVSEMPSQRENLLTIFVIFWHTEMVIPEA